MENTQSLNISRLHSVMVGWEENCSKKNCKSSKDKISQGEGQDNIYGKGH